MGRASALHQPSQDSGIASCRIEQPIRAVMDDQSYDGSAGVTRARPPTFRRGGRGLGQRRHVALAIPATTGGGSEPTIEAVGEAATGHEPVHQAECQKASKTVRPSHAHGCDLNSVQGVACHRITGRDPPHIGTPEWLEARSADSRCQPARLARGSTDRPIGARFWRLLHGVSG